LSENFKQEVLPQKTFPQPLCRCWIN